MGMRRTVVGCGTVLVGLNGNFFLQPHVARLVMKDKGLQNSFEIFCGVMFCFFLQCVMEKVLFTRKKN